MIAPPPPPPVPGKHTHTYELTSSPLTGDSTTDWTFIPPLVTWYYRAHPRASNNYRSDILYALVMIWAVRLTWNYFRREEWKFGQREDWRYVEEMRGETRRD